MQIQLSDRWLLTPNAAEVVDMVWPEGGNGAVPPFAGEDNPVMAVWRYSRTECAYFKGRKPWRWPGPVVARRDELESGGVKGVNHG